MTQSLPFSQHFGIKTQGGLHSPSVSSDLSCPVWGCFCCSSNSPKFRRQLTSAFPKSSQAADTQEWVNEWMTWWLRGGSHKGHRTFLVSIIGSSVTSQEGMPLSGKIISPQFLKGPLKRHPFAPLKRTFTAVCICVEIGVTPSSSPRTMGENFASCLYKGPSRWNSQTKRDSFKSYSWKRRLPASLPSPAPPTPWHFLIKIEEEISPPLHPHPQCTDGEMEPRQAWLLSFTSCETLKFPEPLPSRLWKIK